MTQPLPQEEEVQPQVGMTNERLKEWLSSLNIPSVVDITATRIPDTFYVLFNGSLLLSHTEQLELIGIFCRWDDSVYGGNSRYLVTYKGSK